MLLLHDFNITFSPKIEEHMSRDRKEELCDICAAVYLEVSAVAPIALLVMTCYSEIMCILTSVSVFHVPR